MIAVTKGLLGGLETAVASAAKKDGTTAPFADTFQQVSAKQTDQATKVVAQSLINAARATSGKKTGGASVAANGVKWASGTEVVAAAPDAEMSDGRATGVIRPTGGTDEQPTAGSAKKGTDAAGSIEEEAEPVASKQELMPTVSVPTSGKIAAAQPKIASQGQDAVPSSAPPIQGDLLQGAEVLGQHREPTKLQGAGTIETVSTDASAVTTVVGEGSKRGSIVPTALPLAPDAGREGTGIIGLASQVGKEPASRDTVALVLPSGGAFGNVVARPAEDAGSTPTPPVSATVAGAPEAVGKTPRHGIASSAQGVNRLQSAQAGAATADAKLAADTPDQAAHAQTAVSDVSTTGQGATALVSSVEPARPPMAEPTGDSYFVPAKVPRERKAIWVEGPAYVAPADAGTAGVSAKGVETGVNARVSSTTGKRAGLSTDGSSKEGVFGVASNVIVGPSEILPMASMTATLGVQTVSVLPAAVPAPDNKISAGVEEALPSFASVSGVTSQPVASKAADGVAPVVAPSEPEGVLPPETFAEAVSASTAAFQGAKLASPENLDKDAVHVPASSSVKNGAPRGVSGGDTSVGRERKEASTKSGAASDAANPAETRITAADTASPAVTPHASKTMTSEHHVAPSSEAQALGGGSRSVEVVDAAISSQAISMGSSVATPSVHAMSSSAKADGSQARMGAETAASQAGVQNTDPVLSPMAHTTLSATPTVLEVGVPGGTQGWLKIRAEIGEGGVVQASMSASTHAGQDALHRDLPAISAFLESEHVPVNLQVAHGTSASVANLLSGGDPMKESGFDSASSMGQSLSQNASSSGGAGSSETAARTSAGAGGNGQNDGQPRDGYGRESGVSEAKSATRPGPAADWSTPAGYGSGSARGGGSWLNVIA